MWNKFATIIISIAFIVQNLSSTELHTISIDTSFKNISGELNYCSIYASESGHILCQAFTGWGDTIQHYNGYCKDGLFHEFERIAIPGGTKPYRIDFDLSLISREILKTNDGFCIANCIDDSTARIQPMHYCKNFETDSVYFMDGTVKLKGSMFTNPDSIYTGKVILSEARKSPNGVLFAPVNFSLLNSNPLYCKYEDGKWKQVTSFLDFNSILFLQKKSTLDNNDNLIISKMVVNEYSCIQRFRPDGTIDTILDSETVPFTSFGSYQPQPFRFPQLLEYDSNRDIVYGVNSVPELIYYKDNKWYFDSTFYDIHQGKYKRLINRVLIDSNSTQYFLFDYDTRNSVAADSLFIRDSDGNQSSIPIPAGHDNMFFGDKGKIWITGSKGAYLGKSYIYDPYSHESGVVEIGSLLPTLHTKELFPNPASSKVTAKFWGIDKYVKSMSVGLYNSMGIKIMDLDDNIHYDKSTEQGSIEFNISEIPVGLYYIYYSSRDVKRLQSLVIYR